MKTTAAKVANEIRKILKKDYPHIKFRVNSENYAGGDSVAVHIEREKYLRDLAVEITKKLDFFSKGHFDGMTDSYIYKDNSENTPRVQFIFVHKDW